MNKRDAVQNLVDLGRTTKEISVQLGIPIATVRYYREMRRKVNQSSRITEHRRRVKLKAIDYSGGKCVKCGYDKCAAALSFHHTDPSAKEHQISIGKCLGWDKIKLELDKTLLICNNCHSEVHAGLWHITQDLLQQQNIIRHNYIDKDLASYK